jgi:low affinity Fe/Cu permease
VHFFDRIADKLGAFFSRGHVFMAWVIGTAIWVWCFRYVPADMAKSDFAERANFHQIFWLTLVNIFTLFYCIWISNNQIRGNRSNDEKFNLLADALAHQMRVMAKTIEGQTDIRDIQNELNQAAQELCEAIGKEKEVPT